MLNYRLIKFGSRMSGRDSAMYCMAVLARTTFAVSNKPQPYGRPPCPVAQRYAAKRRFVKQVLHSTDNYVIIGCNGKLV